MQRKIFKKSWWICRRSSNIGSGISHSAVTKYGCFFCMHAARQWKYTFEHFDAFSPLGLVYSRFILATTTKSLGGWAISFPGPLARRQAPAEGRRPEGEGANIDRHLVPYHGKCKRIQSHIEFIPSPGAKRGPRAEGEGANIDRRLVPYHAKCMRIQSRIEFIYIYMWPALGKRTLTLLRTVRKSRLQTVR